MVKLDAASALVYSTYLGGSSWDWGQAVASDTHGNAYVMGDTSSTDFPTAGTRSQPTPGGLGDVFVTKLGPTSALVYSTYRNLTVTMKGGTVERRDCPALHALRSVPIS